MKNNKEVKKKVMQTNKIYNILVVLLVVLGIAPALQAQVTIGSDEIPAKAALLDLKSQSPDASNITSTTGGLLLPRVMLVNPTTLEPFVATTDATWTNSTLKSELTAKHIGLQVYNLAVTNGFTRGMYIWDGATWQKQELSGGGAQQNINYYFTLPTFNIELEETTAEQTVDLYAEYVRQFTRKSTADNTFVSNPSYDLDLLPMVGTDRLYRRDELNYIITYFDDTVIVPTAISVSDEGKLTFKLQSATPAVSVNTYLNVFFLVKR